MFLHCLLVPQDWAVGNRKNGRGVERKERRREEGEGREKGGERKSMKKKIGDCFF